MCELCRLVVAFGSFVFAESNRLRLRCFPLWQWKGPGGLATFPRDLNRAAWARDDQINKKTVTIRNIHDISI